MSWPHAARPAGPCTVTTGEAAARIARRSTSSAGAGEPAPRCRVSSAGYRDSTPAGA
ncbi:MAG TPA: hypothetical protein VL913_00180 [Candidatus Micrarchaeaceae archaeon]|nr:hypothetical protein [Candidatus Micrarchaeaceae archaeon]